MGDEGHSHAETAEKDDPIHQMMEMHKGHVHAHDFEAMENVSREDAHRIINMMSDVGLVLPPMDSHRRLFPEAGKPVGRIAGMAGSTGFDHVRE